MSVTTLRTVTRTQGNNRALKDGTVRPAGFEFDFEEVPVLIDGFRRMVRGLRQRAQLSAWRQRRTQARLHGRVQRKHAPCHDHRARAMAVGQRQPQAGYLGTRLLQQRQRHRVLFGGFGHGQRQRAQLAPAGPVDPGAGLGPVTAADACKKALRQR